MIGVDVFLQRTFVISNKQYLLWLCWDYARNHKRLLDAHRIATSGKGDMGS